MVVGGHSTTATKRDNCDLHVSFREPLVSSSFGNAFSSRLPGFICVRRIVYVSPFLRFSIYFWLGSRNPTHTHMDPIWQHLVLPTSLSLFPENSSKETLRRIWPVRPHP